MLIQSMLFSESKSCYLDQNHWSRDTFYQSYFQICYSTKSQLFTLPYSSLEQKLAIAMSPKEDITIPK